MSTDPSLEKGFRTGSVSSLAPSFLGSLFHEFSHIAACSTPHGRKGSLAEQVQVTQDCLKAGGWS